MNLFYEGLVPALMQTVDEQEEKGKKNINISARTLCWHLAGSLL